MKRISTLAVGLFMFMAVANTSQATLEGNVFCDANGNGTIDAGDAPVPSVLVIVTNLSGTFSNASWTAADGFFIAQLLDTPDSYVDYILPATLPIGTTELLPGFNQFSTTTNNLFATNNFLIENSNCVAVVTPPPQTNMCWLTGGGAIRVDLGKPTHSFGGVVYPGCKPAASRGGSWNDVDHAAKLHFKATFITVVNCGNVPGWPPGSTSPKTPFNYIDFQGVGTLKGIAGNKADYGMVSFYARAEDLGEPGIGVDRYYLRVFDSNGNTLVLVSEDQANPLDVAPIRISAGNLQIHISGCDKR